MRRLKKLAVATVLLAGPLAPAHALCSYGGVMNAATTLEQEFRDSRWVVRVRVISADDHWSDEDESWTLYRLQPLHAYKGAPPRQFRFFTLRNSGGFYMDIPWAGHDLGGEYLLFLNPNPPYRGMPAARRGTVFVNYACGQSRRWNEVRAAERRRLDAMSGRRSIRRLPASA